MHPAWKETFVCVHMYHDIEVYFLSIVSTEITSRYFLKIKWYIFCARGVYEAMT